MHSTALSNAGIGLTILALFFGSTDATAQDLVFSNRTKQAGVDMFHRTPPAVDCCFDWHTEMGGMACGDFDRDGWSDLIVAGGGGRDEPDRLFMNNGDGTFTDRAQAWGIADPHIGSGYAVGDFDKDGWLDVYVTSMGDPAAPSTGQHRLYRNNGNNTFTDVAATAGVNFTSTVRTDGTGSAFGDYDLDGDLDLFVAGWHADVPSDGNRLFRNEGNGTFTDVTNQAGLVLGWTHGFSPWFCDMDGDTYPELLLSGDFATSRYFINNGDGTFTDHTVASGTGLDDNGMGATVGDYNNDGRMDWYVSSIYQDPPHAFEGLGNMLYMNQGNHQFEEVGAIAGVNNGAWGWGSVSVDLNNDGWLEIVENNGWAIITNGFFNEPARVFRNLSDGTFAEVADSAGIDYYGDGRSLVHMDYDRDGDLDLVFYGNRDELGLYRNDQTSNNSWLRVALNTDRRPDFAPDGFGAKIEAKVGKRSLMRMGTYGCNYISQSEMIAHFGLGSVQSVDTLRVTWPDGSTSVRKDVPVNQTLIVRP